MKIKKAEIKEIIRLIENETLFEATSSDGGFTIKINKYVPYCCTAIHNGSQLRPELHSKIALDEYQRWYEEDPFTADFIASMPITIEGNDSRFEYDLNRRPEDCVYDEAWGQKVWTRKLTPRETRQSKKKHANYYKVLHALIQKLESLFGGCVVYDIHSYNFERWERDVPLFNIGTENIDQKRYDSTIQHWKEELQSIQLPNIVNQSEINDVFYGRGYNLEYLSTNFENTLVLATEVKKVYCNELTGDIYPKVIRLLQKHFKRVILNNANLFSQKLDKWHHFSTSKLLDRSIDSKVLSIDKKLYSLLHNFELLGAVNPVNSNTEKRKFLRNKGTALPKFKYNQTKIYPQQLKKELLNLPINQIQDISIRNLYEAVVNSYFDKTDLVGALGTPKFLYNSLRYFGRPSKNDLVNANYILYLPDVFGEVKKEPLIHAEQAQGIFKEHLDKYKINAKIEISNKVISKVMVLNSKRKILFNPKASFTKTEIQALMEHEIGIHMVTTMNSAEQELKIFNLGLPVNTMTQEGLAILAECLSGNITLKRLKILALRVIAVDAMCNGADFNECYHLLVDKYKLNTSTAFDMTTRVFRGGGFTKDFLYLRGFVKILQFWEAQNDLDPLLIGKTSLSYYNTIQEMIDREMIVKPQYFTLSFSNPNIENNNPVYNYILSGLK